MSWTFNIEVHVGNDKWKSLDYSANMTYNVSPMYYDAFDDLGGIRVLDKRECAAAVPDIVAAIERMEADPDKYKAMNPKNGWGDYDGALKLLHTLKEWAIDCPAARFSVW